MSRVCCVCTESKESSENPLFRCGGQPGQGCGIVVHQACYGIVTPPPGVWFCRKCESQERAARVKCELCPRKDGALKRTDSGGWAHVVCALYIPEVTFGDLRSMEPVITSKLPRERFAKTCSICEHKGLETTGACMSCHKSNCRLAFHVTCAQRENLLVEEEDQRDSRNIIYCGYCPTHYRRMIRQKRKQSLLRKNAAEGEAGGVSRNANVSGASHSHFVAIGGTDSDDPVTDKTRHKNAVENRLTKRPHADVPTAGSGAGPVQKRKFSRKRKISSSNESTTSEALSNTSEAHNMVGSPSGMAHIHSPNTYYPGGGVGGANTSKRPAPDEGDQSSMAGIAAAMAGNFSGECENLDLLASVTQRVNMHQPHASAGTPSTSTTSKKSRSHSSAVAPPTNSSLQQHHVRANSVYPSASPSATAGKKKRVSSGASVKQQKNSAVHVAAVQPPPKSLEELLERQWEQTAQFILDQAGSKNNAGVMLAHLHELQSENRKMQARIMELASQREFFIATNGRLRQTLVESGGITRVLNGIQLLASDGQAQNSHDGEEAMEVDGNDASQAGSGTKRAATSTADMSSGVPQSKASLVSSHGATTDVDVHPHLSHGPSASGTSSHEVTHVTNSVQGPIATYTALPNLVGSVPNQRNPLSE